MSWVMSLLGLLVKAFGLSAYLILAILIFGAIAGIDVLWRFLSALSEIWLLQTIGAAWIALAFQKAQSTSARKLDELNRVHERRVASTKAVLGLIDSRLYASRRYLAALESEPELILQEREFYKDTVYQWNALIKTHQISVLIDFRDSYFGLEIEHFFMPKFLHLDRLLRAHRLEAQSGVRPSAIRAREIHHTMQDISVTALTIMRRMLLVAKRDREILDTKPSLTRENLSVISFGQLFSALFGRRQEF